jgi:hypothetical protein
LAIPRRETRPWCARTCSTGRSAKHSRDVTTGLDTTTSLFPCHAGRGRESDAWNRPSDFSLSPCWRPQP